MTAREADREGGRKKTRYLALIPAILFAGFLLFLISPPGASLGMTDSEPLAAPSPTPDPFERLAEPPLSDPPTQVESGHHAYWFSCMVCHGDRGQGLTDEWRNVNPPEDRDCWQSRCHAPNHPPEGFEIPRTAPAVMGQGVLSNYETAAELYAYTKETMPWPFPGERTDEEYWQITAYLAAANRIVLREEPIGPDNAATVYLKLRHDLGWQPSANLERTMTLVVLALLLTALTVYRWMQVT